MPWKLRKVKGGYVVVTTDTGHVHSKHAMSKEMAMKQLAVLNIKKKRGLID